MAKLTRQSFEVEVGARGDLFAHHPPRFDFGGWAARRDLEQS
jgi:hypothetical protein